MYHLEPESKEKEATRRFSLASSISSTSIKVPTRIKGRYTSKFSFDLKSLNCTVTYSIRSIHGFCCPVFSLPEAVKGLQEKPVQKEIGGYC